MSAIFAMLSLWETLAILFVMLVLFCFRPSSEPRLPKVNISEELIIWLAHGFGVGLLPKGPGTWGSLVGIVWFTVLVSFGRMDAYIVGMILGIPASIWICGQAEKILKQHDPSSVVLDEIIALPICFLPWVICLWKPAGEMPPVSAFFAGNTWLGVLVVFGLFRLFDIWKPGPIGKIQNLPGGLGVTADDVLAGVATALVVAGYLWFH